MIVSLLPKHAVDKLVFNILSANFAHLRDLGQRARLKLIAELLLVFFEFLISFKFVNFFVICPFLRLLDLLDQECVQVFMSLVKYRLTHLALMGPKHNLVRSCSSSSIESLPFILDALNALIFFILCEKLS